MPADTEHLYKRGRTWWLRYRGVRRSLRTQVLAVARQARARAIEAIDRERCGLERHTWRQAVGRWLTEVAPRSLKPSTLARYEWSLRAVAPVLEPLYLDQITRRTIAELAGRKGVANATLRRDLTAVSSVLRAAVAWGWIEVNPVHGYDTRVIPERRDPIVLPTDAAVERFVATLPRMLRYVVRFLAATGLRVGEVQSLTWRQVDLARKALILERTKAGRARSVPLSEAALAVLRDVPRHLHCEHVFWHGQENPLPYRDLKDLLSVRRRQAGVQFRTHDLRHLFAVRHLQAGGSIYELQGILGHGSVKVTEGYLAHLTPAEAIEAKRLAR